jgi:hypothetical protein
MDWPSLTRVRQRFDSTHIDDVEGEVRRQLVGSGVTIRPGGSIAIATGSRGIDNIAAIVRCVVRWVRGQGGEPFIVPAMGSHGGATAEGQQQVLEGYGVTEAWCGAPIRSSMDVVQLPQGDVPVPVYLDRYASQADGVIVVNRVKPHTSFHGPYESGLAKMISIGLGKHAQALAIHDLGVRGLREVMPQVARAVLATGKILLGVAIVENAYDKTMRVRAIPASRIMEEEPSLLDLARRHMPRLPVEDIDILIVDEMGKDISGVGMDTNVIGRLKIRDQHEPETPRIKMIFVRDLSAGTHGSAVGIGLADVTTRRLFEKIDLGATYENVVTTTFLERGKIPIIAATDRQGMEIAARGCGLADARHARIVRIRNTLHLDELLVSPAVLEDLRGQGGIEVGEVVGDVLEAGGNMTSFGG